MEEIVKRIIQILEEQQLSSSAFADTIGVQRSSISHVLSGRNKPSLEFILKTVRAFPAYSTDWLLFGKDACLHFLLEHKNKKRSILLCAYKFVDQ